MRKIFLCNYLSRNENRNDSMDAMDESFSENEQPTTTAAPEKKKRKRLHLGRWQKSFATLHAYKDALVPDLLSIWDIEMEEDKGAVIHLSNLETSRHIKPDPEKKVENWLTTNHRSTAPMVVIPRFSDTLGYGDTEPIIPEETNTSLNLNETQDSINFDNVIQSTQIVNETAIEALNVSTLNESTRTQMKETIVQQNTSAIEATQLNTTESAAAEHTLNTTSNSLNKSKTKKKSKKYVKGF